MSNLFDPNDPLVKEFLSDPDVMAIQKELNEVITAEYAVFDHLDFVGEAAAGLVKVFYCYGKKGYYKVEIDDSVYADKDCALGCVPVAMNDALAKYNDGLKAVDARVLAKENEMYLKLVDLAMKKRGVDVPSIAPSKKNYLN